MTTDDAIAFLSTAKRDELRDHAFGDCEVHWDIGEGTIADGYFGTDERSVTVYFPDGNVTFTGADADKLRNCGARGGVERNDSTGPETYREGACMPGLTRDGVLRELCDPDYEPDADRFLNACDECGVDIPDSQTVCRSCAKETT